MTRPNWHDYFLNIAKVVSTRSQCLRAKHGSVIVDENNRILSTGYNNPPPGLPGCEEAGECLIVDRPHYGPSCRRTVHSEISALMYLDKKDIAKPKKIYITGTPCGTCLEYILKFNIKEIICGADYKSSHGEQERNNLLVSFQAKMWHKI